MPDKVYRTAIYCRLSREDGDKVESNSIASQRAICEDYIARHEDLELVCEPFVDDGYSGVSFNRPQFKKLEEAIRKGALDCIVVKDLSRFSRNYIDGGRYIEKIFPQLGIRFIAINDAYDSLTGDPQSDSFVIPFKNLINDSYCKDISMKIRSSLEVKQKSGEFVGSFAPYGYMKSPENKNQLIVDEAVSEYVQMIFSMYKDGFSIGRIAKRLNQMGVLSPMEYKHSAGVKFDTVFKTGDTAKWTYKAVQRILTNEVYIGVLAQGKRGTPNYKVRVVKSKDESEWVKVENAHEALVSYEDFMAVKVMMQRDMRCSPDQDEAHLFSGFLFCGDCQQPMIRKTVPSKTKKYIYYVCSTNKHSRTCSPHSIAAKEVEEKVFRAIHDQIELVINLEHALAMIERLPSQSRKAFNYEAQIATAQQQANEISNLISQQQAQLDQIAEEKRQAEEEAARQAAAEEAARQQAAAEEAASEEAAELATEEAAELAEPPQAVRARAATETAAAAMKLRREIFFIFKHSSLCAYRLHLSAAMRFIEKSESVFSIGCTI